MLTSVYENLKFLQNTPANNITQKKANNLCAPAWYFSIITLDKTEGGFLIWGVFATIYIYKFNREVFKKC